MEEKRMEYRESAVADPLWYITDTGSSARKGAEDSFVGCQRFSFRRKLAESQSVIAPIPRYLKVSSIHS